MATHFRWTYKAAGRSGEYTFSLRNRLREDVTKVRCMLIFYVNRVNPLDVNNTTYRGKVVPAGLAKRVEG